MNKQELIQHLQQVLPEDGDVLFSFLTQEEIAELISSSGYRITEGKTLDDVMYELYKLQGHGMPVTSSEVVDHFWTMQTLDEED